MATLKKRSSKQWGLLGLLLLWGIIMGSVEYASHRANAPDLQQQIAAKLIHWGHALDGIPLPVDPEEIDQRIGQLQSPVSEQRVQAADWLAAHGVRSAGPDIAAAMTNPQTQRPCQLAKALGRLGDPAWTNTLINASLQSSNRDLAVCATYALCELAASDSIETLKENYRRNIAPIFALEALGQIADPATLDFLRQVTGAPRNPIEENVARQALHRTEIMSHPNPEIALCEKLKTVAPNKTPEEWTFRKLSFIKSEQVVTALTQALQDSRENQKKLQINLTAALLAQGQPGRDALHHIVNSAGTPQRQSIARIALAMCVDHKDTLN